MTRPPRPFPSLVIASSLLLPGYGAAQVTARAITDVVTCEGCAIHRELWVTITDTASPGALGGGGVIIHPVKSGGFLLVAGPGRITDEVYWADTAGVIRRRIGDRGSGPGEFRLPNAFLEAHDSFIVVDPAQPRLTWLTKSDLDPVRTSPLPVRGSGVPPIVFGDGAIIYVSSPSPAPPTNGPFHLISSSGDLVMSFGARGAPGTPSLPSGLAVSGDSAFWAGYDDYTLELWHRRGELLAVYRRISEWSSPRNAQTGFGERYTRLSGLTEDGEGRLWVHLVSRVRLGPGMSEADPEIRSRFESRVEVLDPRLAALLAYSTVRGVKDVSIRGNYPAQQIDRYDPEGVRYVDIYCDRLEPVQRSCPQGGSEK